MSLLDWLFPPRCLACSQWTRQDSLCDACEGAWPVLRSPSCTVCRLPFESTESSLDLCDHLCGDCLENEKPFSRLTAAGLYQGILLDLVVRLKYRSEERLASYLGKRMANEIEANNYNLIVPVPLHKDRLRERGFNQAVLLAREIGKRLSVEVDPFLLVKKKKTLPQVALKGKERRDNLKNAFDLRDSEKASSKIDGKKVLLVDDVYTTGTTMAAAAEKLLQGGAKEVEAMVLARAVY